LFPIRYILSCSLFRLKEHCSQLISSNWESFSAQDFVELGPELVYEMLKAKARYPLHSAIQGQTTFIVFCFINFFACKETL
jgi:hypothetical protein